MNNKIIFFDGDGTLWYPTSTKRTKPPHWVYEKNLLPKDYLPHLSVIPGVVNTLKYLKKKGLILVALSTHPHKRVDADIHMLSKIEYLKLDGLFDYVYTARPFPWGKGKVMESLLKKLKIPKYNALLVGDSYVYDYLSAKEVGIKCLLIKTTYTESLNEKVPTKNIISETNELLQR